MKKNNIILPFFVMKVVLFIVFTLFFTSKSIPVLARVLYLTNSSYSSETGDGSITNPYRNFDYAISQAQDYDTIKLLNDITYYNTHHLNINKNITIDGSSNSSKYKLTLLGGTSMMFKSDATLKNIDLRIDGAIGVDPKIYICDYNVIFDNVSTSIRNNSRYIYPVLILGVNENYDTTGNGALLEIKGADRRNPTVFSNIYMGNEYSIKHTP